MIFCVMDEFVKNLHAELRKNLRLEAPEDGTRHRNRRGKPREDGIMTILVCCHFFGSSRNFKHHCLSYIRSHFESCFLDAVPYDKFVEIIPRMFFHMMLFIRFQVFWKYLGISLLDDTMILIRHNPMRRSNKVFKDIAADGRGTTGWCHGFMLHLLCNDCGEVMTFCLTGVDTGADVDGRDARAWNVPLKSFMARSCRQGTRQVGTF